jgi:hypothetical protein
LLKHRGGDAKFSEGGVGDALAGRIVGCDSDKCVLQAVEVRPFLISRESVFEVEPALDQLDALDRVALSVDLLLQLFGGGGWSASGGFGGGEAVVRALR